MEVPTSYIPSVMELGGLIALVGRAVRLFVLGKRVIHEKVSGCFRG